MSFRRIVVRSCALALMAAGRRRFRTAQAGVVVAASGPSAQDLSGRQASWAPPTRSCCKAGDTLTVLDEKGTRVLRGAGTVSLASKTAADRSGTFALLTRQRSAQRVRTGAVRGDKPGPITRPNLWYVDVRQSGPMCLANPAEVRLWRPATTGEALYAIAPDGGKATSKAAFGDGEMLTVWDLSQAPVTDGASYVVAGQDGKPARDHVPRARSVPASSRRPGAQADRKRLHRAARRAVFGDD